MIGVGDRLRVSGLVRLADRPQEPYETEGAGLLASVVDIDTNERGTAICLETGEAWLDRLRPWLDPADVIVSVELPSLGRVKVWTVRP